MGRALVLTGLCAVLAGCAQVGPVQPPSAGVPAVVRDFAAERSGPDVRLSWTPPARTSDDVAWKTAKFGVITYQVCVWPGPAATAKQCPKALPLPDHALAAAALGSPGPLFVTVALGAQNAQGASAGWSNRVTVPLTPVAAPPTFQTATPSDAGVTLRWQAPPQPPGAPSPEVVIYRMPAAGNATVLATVAAAPAGSEATYLDAEAPINQNSTYWLRSRAGAGPAAVESADSRRLEVSTADIFAPAAPTGLEAAAASTGVALSWSPSPARDLAGYNVYRQLSPASPWTKLNSQIVPTPAYFDPQPASPAPARYAVTAVDQAGNESPRSASATPR